MERVSVAPTNDLEYQARVLLGLAERYFTDPKNQEAFERWKQQKEMQKG